jgi:hypothetical protein
LTATIAPPPSTRLITPTAIHTTIHLGCHREDEIGTHVLEGKTSSP